MRQWSNLNGCMNIDLLCHQCGTRLVVDLLTYDLGSCLLRIGNLLPSYGQYRASEYIYKPSCAFSVLPQNTGA